MNNNLTTTNQNSKTALAKSKSLFDITNKLISKKVTKEILIPYDVWLDPETKLMWQDDKAVITIEKQWVTEYNYSKGSHMDTSGDTAATYANNLLLGGYNDWRLPTKDELVDLYKKKDNLKNVRFGPFRDYWSSTTTEDNIYEAWSVYYGNSIDVNNTPKDNNHYVRCVRTVNTKSV